MRTNFKKICLFLAAPAVLALCASCAAPPREAAPELYWPFPPEKPRIKFVDMIVGSIDVTAESKLSLTAIFFGAEAEARMTKPSFAAVSGGVLYVNDIKYIHVFDVKRKKHALLGRKDFGNLTGIAALPDGRLVVGDSGFRKVYIVDPEEKTIAPFGPPSGFVTPAGIAVDAKRGRIVIADAGAHVITVWGLDGSFIFSKGSGERSDKFGQFNMPYDVAVDSEGRIIVADSGNFRIQVFDKDGGLVSAFGGAGAQVGFFSRPKGIAVDSEDHIYVMDAAFGNFQIFDTWGNVFLVVGASGAEPGKFLLPSDVCIDENDRIYVVDQMNYRIQIFQYLKY